MYFICILYKHKTTILTHTHSARSWCNVAFCLSMPNTKIRNTVQCICIQYI